MKKNMYRPVLMGLAMAALLISALAATSYPAHDASSAHAAIGSNTAVPAAPSNLTAKAVGTTSVRLTWTNNAGNQSGVVISRDGVESVDLQGATVSSYTWNGLSPNTKYWFYVASKIYGTPGDPTGYGNTQSAWVGPVYATTVGTQPSTSPAQRPSTAGPGVQSAGAQGYGAWAWSEGDMLNSVKSGLGDTQAQAEAAAVQACKAAGGGSADSGPCYARAWFENAYSSFAPDSSGTHWGLGYAGSSAEADSFALSGCNQQSGTQGCAVAARAQTATPASLSSTGAVIQATPSYGVWAISPSTHVAAWGVGDTRQHAQHVAATNCEQAGGLADECRVYGGWVQNAYSAMFMGANDSWSISDATSPSRANDLARHECQTVKAVGLTCTLAGSGATNDPWLAQKLEWIDQPTQLPTQPSPNFVCVTGPGGSCLKPGAGVSVPQTWTPILPGWLTSPVTGGCVLEFVPGSEALDLLTAMGGAVRFDESNGNWIVLLTEAMPLHNCAELAYYIFTHKPVPQNLNFPQKADLPPSIRLLAHDGSTQSLFQPVSTSQLKTLAKLPFLHQRIRDAVVHIGADVALNHKYPAVWGMGAHKRLACKLQHSGYRCGWHSHLKGTSHSGYVLIGVASGSYRLDKVVQAPQAVHSVTALNPLWYISIAAVVVIVAIVVAVLLRRRRATATAQ